MIPVAPLTLFLNDEKCPNNVTVATETISKKQNLKCFAILCVAKTAFVCLSNGIDISL